MLTQERLKELLVYNELTGSFTYTRSRGRKAKGAIAGGTTSDGYIAIKIDNVVHQAHRLAFLYMTGKIPEFVDHKDRIRDNNTWLNLRPITRLGNSRNASKRVDNTSGHTGITSHLGSWRVRVSIQGKNVDIGRYTNIEEAIIARDLAYTSYGFSDGHGKDSTWLPS